MARLFAKGNMNVNAGHQATKIRKTDGPVIFPYVHVSLK